MKKYYPLLSILAIMVLNSHRNLLPGNNQVPTVDSIHHANGKPAILNGPNGRKYKIDFWADPNEPSSGIEAAMASNCSDNHFTGQDRRAAKTSAVSANAYQSFTNFSDIFTTYRLPSDNAMKTIVTTRSPRTSNENKGVILDKAFLYAFKRESDNDYHLIIGDNANVNQATLLNMEISGIPTPDVTAIDNARSSFVKALKINDKTCMSSYVVFVDKPVPVHVEGPVFYDIDHSPGSIGPVNGGVSLRPKTSWEIHPITKFSPR